MERITLHSGNIRIVGEYFQPAETHFVPPYPAVIVLHGFGSHKASHRGFGEFLQQNGFVGLTLDLRGHGDSEGELDDHALDDVLAATDWLASRPEVDTQRLAVRGSSLGGMYAIHAAARDQRLKAVVAIATAPERVLLVSLNPRQVRQRIKEWGLEVRVKSERLMSFLKTYDVFAAVRQISPRGLLLIHAEGDTTVPVRWSRELYAAAAEPKRLVLLPGGEHRTAQQDPRVHQMTIEWLRQSL